MKRYLLLSLLGLSYWTAIAQNKTFSVGTTSPNANAALHVEAPNSNQGFIMPRLTTAQRTAAGFQGALSTTDIGLMVYDTDLKGIYIWDGAKWGAAARLALPYQDSIATATGTNNLLTFKYNNAELKRLMRLENLHPNNPGSTLSALQQGTGLAGYFQVNNATAGGTALQGTTNSDLGGALAPVGVYGESTGSGSLGGAFRINNAANTFPAIYSETNGLGNAASFRNINASNSVAALRVETNGTGPGASVNSLNASSSSPGLIVNYAGTGNAIQTTGKIQGGQFVGDGSGLTNLPAVSFPFATSQANAGTLFDITNSGTASAGKFTISNAASTGYALVGESNGAALGAGVYGNNTGTGFGVFGKSNGTAFGSAAVYGEQVGTGDAAGAFRISNAANTYSALYGETNGSGPAIYANQQGTGRAGQFQISNGSNSAAALRGFTSGLGNAAFLTISNPANDSSALYITTNGTGPAIKANAPIDVTVSSTQTIGIHAGVSSPSAVQNRGIQADASGSTAQNFGVYSTGYIDGSNGAYGVYGEAIGSGTSDAFGLYGVTNNFTATTGKTYGVFASAEGGSTNWAGYFNSGNVHIKNGLSVGAVDGTFGNSGEVLTSQGAGVAPIWAPAGGGSGWSLSGNSGTDPLTQFIGTVDAVDLVFRTQNVESMRINKGGKLGINTAPSVTSRMAVSTSVGGETTLEVTNGGSGMAADFTSSNGSQTLYVLNTGSGRAGQFTGSGSGNATLQAQNDGAGGSALALFQSNAGYALDIQQGGVRHSVVTYNSPTTMNDKAGIYNITSASLLYVLGVSGRANGETVVLTSEVAGVRVDIGGGYVVDLVPRIPVTAIFVNGSWRATGAIVP